jgi:hypothetical protein
MKAQIGMTITHHDRAVIDDVQSKMADTDTLAILKFARDLESTPGVTFEIIVSLDEREYRADSFKSAVRLFEQLHLVERKQ